MDKGNKENQGTILLYDVLCLWYQWILHTLLCYCTLGAKWYTIASGNVAKAIYG